MPGSPKDWPEQQQHGASCGMHQFAAQLLQATKGPAHGHDVCAQKQGLHAVAVMHLSEAGHMQTLCGCRIHTFKTAAGWSIQNHVCCLPLRTCSNTPELASVLNSLTQARATAVVMTAATWSCCSGAATAARLSKGAGNADALRPRCCIRWC